MPCVRLQAASEAYKAAKDAAAGVVHGTRGAARSAAGAGAVTKDIGGRAAGSVADSASGVAGTAAVRLAGLHGYF